MSITIEGHCDERGTNEYNLALGEKRAKAARDYLSLLGVSLSRISIMTYGEERQACTQSSEDCWQKNRRAHFVLIK
jgi:peptidoglycan-associated lipoprotein